MKDGDLIIIDERESSGWVDSWTEYLCLKEIPEGFELSIRSHEILAEAMEYVDEEGEDLELPDKINGKSVYCRDGDFIIGEVLVVRPDTDCGEESMGSIKFNDVNGGSFRTIVSSVNSKLKEFRKLNFYEKKFKLYTIV